MRLLASVLLCATGVATLAACKSDQPRQNAAPVAAPSAALAAAASASAAPASASAAPAAADIVAIPAGSLVAGTACGEQPRLPSEEASGVSVALEAFTIDAYPYPNEPSTPPKVAVSQAEAAALCAARGRRLCTELEWERACKGPSNGKYEYGDKYDAKACPTGVGAPPAPGSWGSCKSAFGVFAMHGFVSEWTSSPYNRPVPADGGVSPDGGADDGDAGAPGAVVVRGGTGNSPYAHNRCSASKKADPAAKSKGIGFRCCGGPESSAAYPIASDTTPLGITKVASPADKLVGRVRAALRNGGIKDAMKTENAITELYRWHPVANEELFVARFATGESQIQPVVVALCEATAQLIGRIKEPVDGLGELKVDPSDPGRLTIEAKRADQTGAIRFDYRFGAVVTTPPAWLAPAKAK